MNIWYWTAIMVCVISFGGMSKRSESYNKIDRIWVPLVAVSLIAAVVLSGKLITGIITGLVLLFGNGLLWSLVWGHRGRADFASRINKLKNESEGDSGDQKQS